MDSSSGGARNRTIFSSLRLLEIMTCYESKFRARLITFRLSGIVANRGGAALRLNPVQPLNRLGDTPASKPLVKVVPSAIADALLRYMHERNTDLFGNLNPNIYYADVGN